VAALRAEHRGARDESLVRLRAAGRLRHESAGVDVLHVRLDAAVAFIFVIARFPAGLVLYWMTTNLWTVGQGLITRRLIPKVAPPTAQKRSSRTPAKEMEAPAPAPAVAPAPKADAEPRRVKRKKKARR
jgi:hypothetical protein